jgi:hypothetical protein
MKDSPGLGFVVLGAVGYMGMNGLRALSKIFPLLVEDGIHPYLVSLVDRKIPTQSQKEELANLFGSVPDIVPDVAGTTAPLQLFCSSINPSTPVVFYDASPSAIHRDNLDYVTRLQRNYGWELLYLGEKPIFTNRGRTDEHPLEAIAWAKQRLSNFQYFCDLIELKNPVVLTAKRILEERNLELEEIWLWRAGSSAIKKLTGTDRDGVMGGALEDKSLHDFSISLHLLGPSRVNRIELQGIDGDDHLCVHPDSFALDEPIFLSRDNTPVRIRDVNFRYARSSPADSMTKVDLLWRRADGSSVKGKYLFSWIGTSNCRLEREFRATMNQLKMRPPVGNYRAEGYIQNRKCKYDLEEVRVGLFRCIDPKKRRMWIVANLLYKEQFNLKRFVTVLHENSNDPELVPVHQPEKGARYSQIKSDELAELVLDVAKCATGHIPHQEVTCGRDLTLLAHEAMLLAERAIHERLARAAEPDLARAHKMAMDVSQRKLRFQ